MKVDLKIAEVRTLGVAHWEHEKKLIMSLVAAMKKCVMLYKGG